MDAIDFDYKKCQRLQKAYDQAIADGKEQFTFDGHELLVSYAKYLLEYLHMQFKDVPTGARS